MKITIICEGNNENPLQNKIRKYFSENKSFNSADWINLNNIEYCAGCDCCQTINPGLCAIDDGHNDVLKRYLNSDTVIIITPVKFGCCSSTMKNFIDRTEPLFLSFQVMQDGKSVMKARYDKYPNLVFIGVCENDNTDESQSFTRFINTCNLSAASSKVSIKIVTHNTDLTVIEDMML
jgi:Multimeric flavodoxin WrbA